MWKGPSNYIVLGQAPQWHWICGKLGHGMHGGLLAVRALICWLPSKINQKGCSCYGLESLPHSIREPRMKYLPVCPHTYVDIRPPLHECSAWKASNNGGKSGKWERSDTSGRKEMHSTMGGQWRPGHVQFVILPFFFPYMCGSLQGQLALKNPGKPMERNQTLRKVQAEVCRGTEGFRDAHV